ncbi:AAA family ATPase [Streptomyces sp. TRM72054]|uniref:helix-turn-helix transcriptional regulator n=1 Tax=Streptomyces sp. TRM72054 TaxID=2870562 RepID=UPI001C8B7CCD|nr:AAA family ATPase [Streptomyces sp. TRM72054]MBX9399566.1 AAA family ATPase [Streptomyces sp. TRM72054]
MPQDADQSFFGRDSYLIQLSRLLEKASAGQPWVVLVEGEPGIGKSALVRQWRSHLALPATVVLRTHCDLSEADLRFGVISELIRRLPFAQRAEYPLLQRAIPPEASPFHVGAQLLGLLDELQRNASVVLIVIDDVQWADHASVQALGFVLRRLDADNVMTVLITRTSGVSMVEGPMEDVHQLVEGAEWHFTMSLGGLETEEVALWTAAAGLQKAEQRVVERLWQHTGGNPLYLQTILSEVDPQELFSAGLLPVPASLADGLRRQLTNLPDSSRRLAEAAAVFGTRSPLALVAQLGDVPDPAMALERLLASRIVRWWPHESTQPIEIRHALQRDAIVQSIAPPRLMRLHAAAATLTTGEESWAHRVAATAKSDARLASDLEHAARDHLSSGRVDRAATLLLWARDVADNMAERERYLLLASVHLMWTDEFARVQRLLPAIEKCSPGPLRSLILGAWAIVHGDSAEAEAQLQAAMRGAEQRLVDGWVAAMAGTWLGVLQLFKGDGAKALTVLHDVLQSSPPYQGISGRVVENLTFAHGMVDGAQSAADWLNDFAPLPHAARVSLDKFNLLTIRGVIRSFAGEYRMSVEDLTKALEYGADIGHQVMEEFTHLCRASAYYWLGSWDDTVMDVERALAVARTNEKPWAFVTAYSVAAWVPAGRGEWAKVDEYLRLGAEPGKSAASAYASPIRAMARTILAQARQDWTAMLAGLQPLVGQPSRGMARLLEEEWRPLQAQALIETGRFAEADRALDHLCRLAEHATALRPSEDWLRGRLAETRGDIRAAREFYQRGTSRAATANDIPLHRGLLEHAYGRLMSEAGDRREAEYWLRQACQKFESMRATPFFDRCQADLSRTTLSKGRRRRAHMSLTNRERDIAVLVGRGLTNREIGSELYISSKTVEYHLSNIFSRLGVKDRRELRDRMQQTAPPLTLTNHE